MELLQHKKVACIKKARVPTSKRIVELLVQKAFSFLISVFTLSQVLVYFLLFSWKRIYSLILHVCVFSFRRGFTEWTPLAFTGYILL